MSESGLSKPFVIGLAMVLLVIGIASLAGLVSDEPTTNGVNLDDKQKTVSSKSLPEALKSEPKGSSVTTFSIPKIEKISKTANGNIRSAAARDKQLVDLFRKAEGQKSSTGNKAQSRGLACAIAGMKTLANGECARRSTYASSVYHSVNPPYDGADPWSFESAITLVFFGYPGAVAHLGANQPYPGIRAWDEVAVAVQKYGQPVSYPRITTPENDATLATIWTGCDAYRSLVAVRSKSTGTPWSWPLASPWMVPPQC